MDRIEATRRIIDANNYLTLGTADADGRPWVTPVWFAPHRYTDFVWVSRPGTRHSRNIAVRPEISIVVFDSTVPVGEGVAVYIEALAGQVPADELEAALAIFSGRLVEGGDRSWNLSDVTGPAEFRLYRARASAHYILDGNKDIRVPVDPKEES
jgi:nitroimidazol reductase NimA-like FMN-containing flavoprotein (pyridoxamine 5'-phosphate oxidase superfamily)